MIKIFFTEKFNDVVTVLRVMSVSILFIALNNVYGTNYMLIKGFEKQLRQITTICSIIGFFIALPLIYYFSYLGAAIVITMTRGMLGVVIMVYSRIQIKNSNNC